MDIYAFPSKSIHKIKLKTLQSLVTFGEGEGGSGVQTRSTNCGSNSLGSEPALLALHPLLYTMQYVQGVYNILEQQW